MPPPEPLPGSSPLTPLAELSLRVELMTDSVPALSMPPPMPSPPLTELPLRVELVTDSVPAL